MALCRQGQAQRELPLWGIIRPRQSGPVEHAGAADQGSAGLGGSTDPGAAGGFQVGVPHLTG
eukprot:7339535-Heterocapsa_arctica.AAC.1